MRYTNKMREEANPYGCVAIHARPNLLFGRKRGNLAPPKRCAMGVRDKKKAPTPGVPGAGAVYDSESRREAGR